MKATLSHLTTVHNETCGCQTGSTSHEVMYMVVVKIFLPRLRKTTIFCRNYRNCRKCFKQQYSLKSIWAFERYFQCGSSGKYFCIKTCEKFTTEYENFCATYLAKGWQNILLVSRIAFVEKVLSCNTF